MTQVRFTPQAQRDLIGIAGYIADASGNRKIASDFTSAVREKCHGLAQRSITMGRPRDELLPGLRSLPFRGYVIFFLYVPDAVDIVTIIHGHRDIDAIFGNE